MSDSIKKKTFSITINGLKEAVDLTKSLAQQLKDIDGVLKQINQKKIVIQGEVAMDTKEAEKKIVSGTENEVLNNRETQIAKEKELALQRQINAEIKATAQSQAALTKEYKDALSETIKQQNATKEVKQEVTDMFNGARDSAGNYTNTIAGLRAELRDLAKEQRSVDIASDEYKKLDDRILALTSNLKALEQAHGDFRRNVGNYPTQEIEAFKKKFEELYANMQNLVTESNELQRELAETNPGSEAYNTLQEKIRKVNDELAKAKDSVIQFNDSLRQTPTRFEVQVGETVRNFSSIKDAVKTLTKELQGLTLQGKTNTKEFEDTIRALGRLKTAIKSTGDEVQSYVGNAKGLSDTLEIMRGGAGIVSIGQGLTMLFGGVNKELDESLRKFAGLTLVMQGIETQYKAMNDENSIYGNYLKKVWDWLDKIGNWKIGFLPSLNQAIDKTDEWGTTLKGIASWKSGELANQFKDLNREILQAYHNGTKFDKEVLSDMRELNNKIGTIAITFDSAPAEQKIEKLNALLQQTEARIEQINALRADPNISDERVRELTNELMELQRQLDLINNTKVAIETGDTEKLLEGLDREITDIDEYIKQLNKSGIDTKKFEELWKQLRTVAVNADTVNKNISKTPALLKAMGTAGQYAAKGLNLVVASLKTFLKSTVILYTVQMLFKALTWTIEQLANAFKALKGGSTMDVDKRLDMISDAADRATKKLNDYINAVDKATKSGLLTTLEGEEMKLNAVRDAAMNAAKGLKEFLNEQNKIKKGSLEDNFNTKASRKIIGDDNDIKNLQEFRREYELLEKAVQNGTDKIAAGSKRGWGWLLTAGDAVEELKTKTKAVLGDMQNEIDKIDFNNPEKAIKQFKEITDNELYQSAIANMDKLFPEEEWAQGLKRMYTKFSEMVSDCETRAGDLRQAVIKANSELIDQAELSNINAISDPEKRQAALDAREKKRRQKAINESIADEKYKQEALEALDKEYNQKAIDRHKSYADKNTKVADEEYKNLKQIRDNYLAMMKDGLDKEIKMLENQRDDELREVEKAGKNRGELILSIQEKYNFLIMKKREEWFKKHKKAIEDFNREILAVQTAAAEELARVTGMQKLNDINRGMDENENNHSQNQRNIKYDVESQVDENIAANKRNFEKEKEYHNQMLEEEQRYLEEKHKLQEQEINQNMENLLREEETRYKEENALNEKYQKEKIQEVYDMLQQGIINEEEAQRMQLDIEEKYLTAGQDLYEAHMRTMEEIQKNAQQEQKNLQENALKERQDAQQEANNKVIDCIQDMYDDIDDISEREQKKNTNKTTGLFNLRKERQRLQEVKKAYEDTIKEIEKEYEKLKQQFENGEIDFNAFEEGTKRLDDLKQNAEQSAEETGEAMGSLFQDWGKKLDDFVQEVAAKLEALYSGINEIWSLKLDNDEAKLEQEQKLLDKESEAVEKAYDKQAEIVQRYKDAINDTEDELKNARGERRLALIDGLAKQREAYLQETEALQKQQLEKERIAKKEEQLKKKQDELEKKRKKQEKAQKLVSATINTATGVTQALAAYPPPASMIMAAVVAAMGAAQISLISAQKYANGGQIDAPSHQQGGYKIPTKRGVAELEGNEFVVNKRTTQQNLDMMYFVNSIKRRITLDDFEKYFNSKGKISISPSQSLKYAAGGTLPELVDFNLKEQLQNQQEQPEIKVVAQITDIINATDNYNKIKVLSGLADSTYQK